MKSILFTAFLCLASVFSEAQTQVIKDSLSVSTYIKYEETVDFENYQVKFKGVSNDSRCPKNVMCIRAGEAEVWVAIYRNNNFIKDKKIIIDGSGYVTASNNLIFDAKDFKIYGFDLKPYPASINTTATRDYELEIVFQPKRLE